MKYFLLSVDDGTIYDAKTIAILNRLGLKATFNLNSGLEDYVWNKDGHPITRLRLKDNAFLYKGHEVASHTSTHPYLESCSDADVIKEVQSDVDNLEEIFNHEIICFATPFQTSGEREINLIKEKTSIRGIRVSKIDESFAMPADSYHIYCTTYDIFRAFDLLPNFFSLQGDGLFVFACHSYDFELAGTFTLLEKLLSMMKEKEDVKVITTTELVEMLITR